MIPTLTHVTAGSGLALPEYVQLASQASFVGVEYSIEEAAKLVARTSFEDVAAIFESNNVLPVVFGLPVEWRKDEATFQSDLERLPAFAKLAQDLSTTRCTTWVLPADGSGANLSRDEYAVQSIARFGAIGRVLEAQGIRLGLEFIGPHHFRAQPERVWFYDIAGALDAVFKIEDAFQLENIGLLVDSFHWHTSQATTMDLASIPLEKIVHVHINDAPKIAVEDVLDGVRLLPGEGSIDLQAFLQTLGAIGYDGPIAVETFSEDLKALAPQDAAQRASQTTFAALQKAGIEPLHLV